MKALSILALTLIFATAFCAQGLQTQPALSNEQRWKAEHEAGLKALEQGLYSQAVLAFQVAVREAEKFGSTDLRLAQSISGLAQAYLQQGNFAPAQRQFQQAQAIYEKVAEPNDPNLATVLSSLATLERQRQNYHIKVITTFL